MGPGRLEDHPGKRNTKEEAMNEKPRRHRRIETNLLLYVEQTDAQGRMRMNTVGHVLNLSEGGLLAEMSCPVEMDFESAVVVALGAECVEIRPRLARMERVAPNCFRVAFQFDRRARKARSRIAKFIAHRLGGTVAGKAA
jgi:hypothetical protein